MVKKRKQEQFSVVSAVKANARHRVGQPPPERAIPDAKERVERREVRHKPTLTRDLAAAQSEE